MPSESKPLLTAQTEKPNHYKYLKEFRVEQCPSFLQHKCTQHRPFTCFHWHFHNQRRRRPVRKRDGSFNYSADNYCTKYNETSGTCGDDGEDCPYLHRTAGDTERRYHLRYYKTCMCVHDTDARGFCTKNGPHCAFAHGSADLRPPVYDIKEIQSLDNPDLEPNGAPINPLDKERNLMNEDPKWQDTNYVLSSYKTESCKRPPRLCRQGYACPQYHNSKDKRRSPRKHKYRSTPCPSVKHGEEWGEPSNCETGDACAYCHTRTEQQFHPEIYKSTKCNDVQQAGYCPRGVFCAFAHVEPDEMSMARDLAAPLDGGTSLADILTSALPSDKKGSDPSMLWCVQQNGGGSVEASESASTSSVGSSGGGGTVIGRAPGAPLVAHAPLASGAQSVSQLGHHTSDFRSDLSAQIVALESETALACKQQSLWQQGGSLHASSCFDTTLLHEVVGNALDDPQLDEPLSLAKSLERELAEGEGGARGSAPVSIPGRARYAASFTPGPLFDFSSASLSPSRGELSRLREEVAQSRASARDWEERLAQARAACAAWQREADEAKRAAGAAERRRDDALALAAALRERLEAAPRRRDPRGLSLHALKSAQQQLRLDLEDIEKVLYLETATKCMVCEERNRSVTLPCNHYVLCSECAATQSECPYCQSPVSADDAATQ